MNSLVSNLLSSPDFLTPWPPPTPDSNKNISYTASPTGFPKAQWGTHDLRELETSEKHERVDDGRTEHGAREGSACSPLPITPSIPAFLNN